MGLAGKKMSRKYFKCRCFAAVFLILKIVSDVAPILSVLDLLTLLLIRVHGTVPIGRE